MDKPSNCRPSVIKKLKIEDRHDRSTQQLANGVEKMTGALQQAASEKRRAASILYSLLK